MHWTSGNELLRKLIVLVVDAMFLVDGKLLVVDDYVLDLVQRECTLWIYMSRRVTLMEYEPVTCWRAREVG